MTINIGETIGIGGQAAFTANNRYNFARSILDKANQNPQQEDSDKPNAYTSNFEALKAMALSLTHFAVEEDHYLKESLIKSANGLIQLRSDNFDKLVVTSHDTWIVIYALLDPSAEISKHLINLGNSVAGKVIRHVNVGLIDLLRNKDIIDKHELFKYCDNRVSDDNINDDDIENHDDEDEEESIKKQIKKNRDITDYLPCIRLYPGYPSFSFSDDDLKDSKFNPENTHEYRKNNIFVTGKTYNGAIEVTHVLDYLRDELIRYKLASGSILTASVKIR